MLLVLVGEELQEFGVIQLVLHDQQLDELVGYMIDESEVIQLYDHLSV